MSVVAHTNIDNDIASVQLNSEPEITSISVSARIDYIQRFSKQAVLVIDSETHIYAQAARQFLINLSKDKSSQDSNVAFVSASTKLNDIQMRCRLIEQLFANTLFDPEKSLAVSILTLSKESKDNITIVVEHAQALSLQVKYELCQLVDVANKTHSKIKVVLFGQEQAAEEVAANKTIFKNKLAIIDAKSGQLFSLDHAKFNTDNSILTKKFWQKLVIVVVTISALVGLSWVMLIEYDNFSLSQLPDVNSIAQEKKSIELNPTQNDDIIKPLVTLDLLPVENLAEVSDIHSALLEGKTSGLEVKNTRALAKDVLQALDVKADRLTPSQVVESSKQTIDSGVNNSTLDKAVVPVKIVDDELNELANIESPLKLTQNYYFSSLTGYVVQIVGFTDMTLLDRFADSYPNLEYFSYQKKLNGVVFVVLTTRIYDSKEQAQEALQTLPQDIIERGVWVKSLSTVKDEINNS